MIADIQRARALGGKTKDEIVRLDAESHRSAIIRILRALRMV